MPGMDTAPPERTDTSNGRRALPKPSPVVASSRCMPLSSAAATAASSAMPSRKARHQEVGSTKAGGTGRPASAMRARLKALAPTASGPPGGRPAPPPMTYIGPVTAQLPSMTSRVIRLARFKASAPSSSACPTSAYRCNWRKSWACCTAS